MIQLRLTMLLRRILNPAATPLWYSGQVVISGEIESRDMVAFVGGQRPTKIRGGIGIGSAEIGFNELRVSMPLPTG